MGGKGISGGAELPSRSDRHGGKQCACRARAGRVPGNGTPAPDRSHVTHLQSEGPPSNSSAGRLGEVRRWLANSRTTGDLIHLFSKNQMAAYGPTLPTWVLRQVVGYPGHTGRDANIAAVAALDPNRTLRSSGWRRRNCAARARL